MNSYRNLNQKFVVTEPLRP